MPRNVTAANVIRCMPWRAEFVVRRAVCDGRRRISQRIRCLTMTAILLYLAASILTSLSRAQPANDVIASASFIILLTYV